MRLALIVLLFACSQIYAQTGPGGVGNAGGTGGQPRNGMWLKSGVGVSVTGSAVNSWADQSGNANDATGSTAPNKPVYVSSDGVFNNQASIDFSLATNSYLTVPNSSNLDNTTGLTSFVVFVPNVVNTVKGVFGKRLSVGSAESYLLYKNNAVLNSRINAGATISSGNILTAGTKLIATTVFNGSITTNTLFQNGNSVASSTSAPGSVGSNSTSTVTIGAFDPSNDGRNLDGKITEVILYTSTLNVAQRIIIENYLSAKFGITIANDVYVSNPAAYIVDIAGIGQSSGTTHIESSSQGFMLAPANGTLDTDGEFILAGHNGTTNAVSTSNLGTGVKQRWARDWYVEKTTGGTLDAFVTFDFGDGIGGQYPQNKNNYVLLRFDGVNYQNVGIANSDKTTNGDRITFNVANATLTPGRYTLGTLDEINSPVNGAAARTWYSYQTGNWSSSTSWTLDGAVVPLFVNPSNETPSSSDNVVVTSGRTITVDVNNTSVLSAQVEGTLDIASTSGHSYTAISGSGKIKIAGSGGLDNFPSGSTTSFADATTGGTVEINGVGITLNQVHTYRNLIVNLSSASTVATLMANITLNGTLEILNGIIKFNDGTSTISKTLTVFGNTRVSSNGQFQVGLGNARHKLSLYGNLINDGGTMAFTNRASAIYTSEATDGIVDVAFYNATADQLLQCNGNSKFYRIEISKGTDDTYKLTIAASSPGFFSLLGYSNTDHASVAQLTTNDNAVGLLIGTLEIQANISIPVLSNNGNYNISAGAQLWVNGGTVNKDIGNSLVPYGKIKVSSGTLSSNVSSGITTRDNGTIIVEGGILNTRQIRTSVLAASNIGGYIQSGGVVTVDGAGGVNTDYAIFSLTYPGNVFNMSGGSLRVKGAFSSTTRGAIFINSDPANVSVTGGTVYMEVSNTNGYKITSRAPFWSVIMLNTNAATTVRTIDLTNTSSGDTSPVDISIALPAQPLVVLNDLTIQDKLNFQANNNDVTIGGNLEIGTSSTSTGNYTPGTNTTKFNGVGVSSIIFNNPTPVPAWNNLTIAKQTATNEVNITSGNTTTGLRLTGALRVEQGIFDYAGFNVSARGSVYIQSVVGKLASAGKLLLDGSTSQTLTSENGSIYNMDINNTSGVVLANKSFTVYKGLTLSNGIFDINTLKLTLSGSSAVINGTGFGTTKMIQLAGNASDQGLELYLDGNKTLTYPIGTNANATVRYTSVTAQFQNFSDDGYISINVSDSELGTTDLTAGANTLLTYYWKVQHTGFTVVPKVTSYVFRAVDSDDADAGATPAGLKAGFVPGKVLNASPFTRSVEIAGNIGGFNITFNGNTTGSGGVPFPLETANYTAGAPARFPVGSTPNVYYTRIFEGGSAASADWRNSYYWTTPSTPGFNSGLSPHDSSQPQASSYPQAGDIAVVGWVPWNDGDVSHRGYPHGIAVNQIENVAELRFTQMLNVSNAPTARFYAFNFQFRPTVCINNNGGTAGDIYGAIISGEGGFWNRSTGGNLSDPIFTGSDLGAFSLQDSSYFIYENTLGSATYANLPATFPNLLMSTDGWGNQDKNSTIQKDITVNGNFELLGNINLLLSTGATGNITVNRNMKFFRSNANGNDSGGGGELRFGNTGTARTITINKDLIFGNGYDELISVGSPGTTPLTHTINLGGNFTQNTTNGFGFKAGTSATNDRIALNLIGSNSMVFSSTAGDAPQLYSLTVNKGSSIATTATFNANFTLNGPTNLATKSLVLQNGLLKLNNASVNLTLSSGGGSFSIPAAAGLEVTQGQVNINGSDTGLLLDGLLRINGGTVSLDDAVNNGNNFIEYSASGSATIEITSGTLTVGSQVRRSLASTAGILKYTQSGGVVTLGRRAAPTTNRGVFEVTNTGSAFTLTGGSFTLTRGIASATIPSLLLDPQTSTVTGSTITIGDSNTPSGSNSQNIGIKATVPVNNLLITGVNSPIAKIYITPLTVNGNLTISSSTTFNAQGLDLNIGNNMVANGTFIPSSNLTKFFNTGAASISGSSPTLDFYNLTKDNGGTLSLSKAITVNKDLAILAGTFSDAGNSITLKGNATIDGIHSSSGGSGLIFNGTTQQQLKRSASGTSTLGIVTIDNAAGVVVPVQGYNFFISSGLRLKQGVLDIGGSLLDLSTSATITPVNPFSVTNMIQTNSSFTDNGVRKNFTAGVATTFTFPVGQLYYTPVQLTGGTTGSSAPSITVRPANERHPIVVEDPEAGGASHPQITDIDNVLQYHWIITAGNATNFTSDMKLYYQPVLVKADATYYTENNYLGAQVLTATNTVTKYLGAVSTAEHSILFNFTTKDTDGISGEYFAGIDDAIPNTIPTFTTKGSGTGTGNVDAAVYTTTVPGGGAPSGAILVVSAGDNLTFNINSVSLYKTTINAGATLTINETIGHRLGTVTGQGTLKIVSSTSSAVLPAAFYNDFFDCTLGGTLDFAGTGSYDILGGITDLKGLLLEGSGTRTLANNDLTICNNFTISGPTFQNTNNRNITVQNSLIFTSGAYNTGTGTLAVTNAFTQSGGTFDGQSGGTKTIGGTFTLSGGTFSIGTGGTWNMKGDVNYSGGTFSGGSGTAKIIFNGTSGQTITGSFTGGVSQLYRMEISNSNGLTLAGNVDVGDQLLLTNGLITTGTNNFTLSSTATITPVNGKSTSFVNGKLRKVISSAASSFIFPVGKSTRWRPASINNTSTGPLTWQAEYFIGNATSEPGVTNLTPNSSTILRVSTEEYWKISDNSTGNNGRIGLSWGTESLVSANFSERESLQVMVWNTPTASRWGNFGGTSFSGGHTQAGGSFVATSNNAFSERIVTLGSTEVANPLPISLAWFKGEIVGNQSYLYWKTESELNNDHFEIQRSVDGHEFEVLGTVKGNGTTKSASNYVYEDPTLKIGKNYYRLKQYDIDGKSSYSETIVLDYDGIVQMGLFVFPNPTRFDNINFKVEGSNDKEVAIRLFDMTGRIVYKAILESKNVSDAMLIDAGTLKTGMYVLEAIQGKSRVTQRVIIKE